MKLTGLLFSVLLLLITVFAEKEPVNASNDEEKMAEPREAECGRFQGESCTKEYNPVCGSDGNMYSTECLLCQHNRNNNLQVKVAKQGPCAGQELLLQD